MLELDHSRESEKSKGQKRNPKLKGNVQRVIRRNDIGGDNSKKFNSKKFKKIPKIIQKTYKKMKNGIKSKGRR